MKRIFQKQLLFICFVFFATTSVQVAMQMPQAASACCICLEEKPQSIGHVIHPYQCQARADHVVCETCWQDCIFQHKYVGQLPLVCPQCRAAVKPDYKRCYVDACLPERPVRLINNEEVIAQDVMLDGMTLGYDIKFGIHGSLSIKPGCSLFLKNIRLKNFRRDCVRGFGRDMQFVVLFQNVEIQRIDDYFFADVLMYPGFLSVNDAPLIWFKQETVFTDRHLRKMLCGSKFADAADIWQASPVAGSAQKDKLETK